MKRQHQRTKRTVRKKRGSSRRNAIPRSKREAEARNRALHALARVRRGESLSQAAQAEHVKLVTIKKYLGNQFHQDAPGKRWKPTKSDRLSVRMNILTPHGMTTVLVRGSGERTRLVIRSNS